VNPNAEAAGRKWRRRAAADVLWLAGGDFIKVVRTVEAALSFVQVSEPRFGNWAMYFAPSQASPLCQSHSSWRFSPQHFTPQEFQRFDLTFKLDARPALH